jgi:hypothetical protein
MTTGGRSEDPRDRTKDPTRTGSAFASGEATDQHINLVKEAFANARGVDVNEFIDANMDRGREWIEGEIRRALQEQMQVNLGP